MEIDQENMIEKVTGKSVVFLKLLREDKNPPRFLLNRVPEQITETNV